jgi:23S rRNA pseudoU1915 N3-methylase RlmH
MFRIIAVGDDFHHFTSGIEEYMKRLPSLSLKLIKSEKSTEAPRIIARETDRIIEYIEKEKLSVVYLDIAGKTYTTETFEKYIERLQIQYPKITFLIG